MVFSIGETIKRLRRERGITQEQLAERLNISAQAVSKWENGLSLPDISQLAPLAREFQVSADVLVGLGTDGTDIGDILEQAYRLPDVEKTYDALQEALACYPNSPALLVNSLECGITLVCPESGGDYNRERAEQIYKNCERQARTLAEYSKNVNDIMRANMIMVILHSSYGNRAAAMKCAEKFPCRPDMTWNKMMSYIANAEGNYKDEVDYCQEDIDLHVYNLASILTQQGLAYEKLERYSDAKNSFRAVFSLVEIFDRERKQLLHLQERGDVYELLIRVCQRLGENEEAERWQMEKPVFD
ncbi:MAG: helix-turn-helix transcriptional regulator [Oscillospiraceae bacterium]|nr:helix-turn-helix transcriptional regulator [Oscillospiraceae bacterium]